MTRRLRTCKNPACRAKFVQWSSFQAACGKVECAIAVARLTAERDRRRWEREERAKQREAKERIKTPADWRREAQAAVNSYVRERDRYEPCISCGRHHSGQYHAGHYRSVAACPEARFDPRNIFKQCAPCNSHLSGNLLAYRARLVELKGEEFVAWLEGPHEPKKYTIDQLREIKATYTAMARQLKKEREQCAA